MELGRATTYQRRPVAVVADATNATDCQRAAQSMAAHMAAKSATLRRQASCAGAIATDDDDGDQSSSNEDKECEEDEEEEEEDDDEEEEEDDDEYEAEEDDCDEDDNNDCQYQDNYCSRVAADGNGNGVDGGDAQDDNDEYCAANEDHDGPPALKRSKVAHANHYDKFATATSNNIASAAATTTTTTTTTTAIATTATATTTSDWLMSDELPPHTDFGLAHHSAAAFHSDLVAIRQPSPNEWRHHHNLGQQRQAAHSASAPPGAAVEASAERAASRNSSSSSSSSGGSQLTSELCASGEFSVAYTIAAVAAAASGTAAPIELNGKDDDHHHHHQNNNNNTSQTRDNNNTATTRIQKRLVEQHSQRAVDDNASEQPASGCQSPANTTTELSQDSSLGQQQQQHESNLRKQQQRLQLLQQHRQSNSKPRAAETRNGQRNGAAMIGVRVANESPVLTDRSQPFGCANSDGSHTDGNQSCTIAHNNSNSIAIAEEHKAEIEIENNHVGCNNNVIGSAANNNGNSKQSMQHQQYQQQCQQQQHQHHHHHHQQQQQQQQQQHQQIQQLQLQGQLQQQQLSQPLQRQYPPNHPLGNSKHLCSICGDRATGKHYGVYSCEGCKGFFKRTIRKDIVYVCRASGNCLIDMRQRNRCQYCRYQKCLRMGMKREAVQEEKQRLKMRAAAIQCLPNNNDICNGQQHEQVNNHFAPINNQYYNNNNNHHLSNKFSQDVEFKDAHYESNNMQEHTEHVDQQSQQQIVSPPTSVTPNGNNYQHLTNNSQLTAPFNSNYRYYTAENTYNDTQGNHIWPRSSFSARRIDDLTLKWAAQVQIEQLIDWSKSVPKFTELLIDDQITLLKAYWNELIIADIAFKSIESISKLEPTLCIGRGLFINASQASEIGLGNMFHRIHGELVAKMHQMRMDANELTCLRAIILFNPETQGLKTSQPIEEYRGNVYTTLEAYCRKHYEEQPNRFGKLLLRLPALRSIGLKCDSMRRCDSKQTSLQYPSSLNNLHHLHHHHHHHHHHQHSSHNQPHLHTHNGLVESSLSLDGSSPSSSCTGSSSSSNGSSGQSTGASLVAGSPNASSNLTGKAPSSNNQPVKLLFFDICYEPTSINSFLRSSLSMH